jgi:hypothetical protein
MVRSLAVALQLERRDIGAIVSLDGTIGENAGGVYLTERSAGDLAKFKAPILHLYTPDNEFLNLQHVRGYGASPRVLVAIPEQRHRDFLAYAAFDPYGAGVFRCPGFSASACWICVGQPILAPFHHRVSARFTSWFGVFADGADRPRCIRPS